MANSIVNPRFLVVSLGNPGALYETLHSAGHLALDSLQSQLASSQPAFTTQRVGKKKARASLGPKYMLAQSPTLMNVSGPWASAAWKSVLADKGLSPADVGLVVVHDDLEEDMGVVKIRKWDTSHRGHNGMKSVKNSLRHADWREARWARISVGIGRPLVRDPDSVSDYVLRPISSHQKQYLRDKAGQAVLKCLLELEADWDRDLAKEATREAAKAVAEAQS